MEQIFVVIERFASASENEIDSILKDKHSLNTQKAKEIANKIFQNYIAEKKFKIDIINTTAIDLNIIIRKFYVEILKLNGGHYT